MLKYFLAIVFFSLSVISHLPLIYIKTSRKLYGPPTDAFIIFLPLKHPGAQPQEFYRDELLFFQMYINVILLLGNFQQNLMVGKSSMSPKVPFWNKKLIFFLLLLTP